MTKIQRDCNITFDDASGKRVVMMVVVMVDEMGTRFQDNCHACCQGKNRLGNLAGGRGVAFVLLTTYTPRAPFKNL